MTKFTPEDLVQYLYKEVSPEQSIAIEKAINNDWSLRDKFEVIRVASHRLNSIQYSPRTELVLSVLRYARRNSIAPEKV